MKKLFSVIFVLVLSAALFISCEGTKTDAPNTVILREVENLSEYVVVRGEKSSSEVASLASSLRKEINEATDASVPIKTDYYSNTYEILIGETKRQQSIDAHRGLRYYDYIIKTDGNKIVIAGGSEKALGDAVELFKTQFIDAEKGIVRVPSGNPYIFQKVLPMEKISVNGVDISEFKILNHSSLSDVTALRDGICETVGTVLAITKEAMLDDGHYIILEATELIVDKYSVTVENGNVIIKGSEHSLDAAMDAFVDTCLKKDGVKTYDVTSADNFEGSIGKKDIYTKDQLKAVIQQVYDDHNKIIIGEQVKGETYQDPEGVAMTIQNFKESTGHMPGIIGIDLGCYGIDVMETNEADWSTYICDLVDYAADGGIITVSAHWENPSSNTQGGDRVRGNFGTENTLEAYEQAFTDLITEGTEYNDFFKAELDTNARFLKALSDNGVPVIWRPLHEANGNWFWYCTIQQEFTLDPSYLVNIWHYVYEYLTEDWGLTNLIWCYGPNYSANVNDTPGSTMSTTYYYPGDDYCDMVGVDWYSNGYLEITDKNNYLNLTDYARKPGAITEFGPTGSILDKTSETQEELYNCMDLYDDLTELIEDEYSFVYLLTWMSYSNVTAMGKGDEFMATDMTLGQAEVKSMLDALK